MASARGIGLAALAIVASLVFAGAAVALPIGPRANVVRGLETRWLERLGVARLLRLRVPLYCGGGARRVVSLTFDDGPGPLTPALLAALAAAHAPATFFDVGEQVADQAPLVAAEARLGVVGDHTWDHARLARISRGRAVSELLRTRRVLARVTGSRVVLFRPPYENGYAAAARLARRLGLLEVLWSDDSRDWQLPSPRLVAAALRSGLEPGAIVLFHAHGANLLPELRWTLRELERRGLQPVTVPALLALDPPTAADLRRDARAGECVRLASH